MVKIPLDKECYEESDFLIENNPILVAPEDTVIKPEDEKKELQKADTDEPLNRKTILLVEDDNDVRDFLASELESCFNLRVATDGQMGLAMAKEEDFDLVVRGAGKSTP